MDSLGPRGDITLLAARAHADYRVRPNKHLLRSYRTRHAARNGLGMIRYVSKPAQMFPATCLQHLRRSQGCDNNGLTIHDDNVLATVRMLVDPLSLPGQILCSRSQHYCFSFFTMVSGCE